MNDGLIEMVAVTNIFLKISLLSITAFFQIVNKKGIAGLPHVDPVINMTEFGILLKDKILFSTCCKLILA